MSKRETDDVDWLAVEFVCNGTRIDLSKDTATLTAAVLAIGFRSTAWQTGERLGVPARRISRILEKTGRSVICLFCGRRVIPDGGVLPHHVMSDGYRCRMVGYRPDDTEQCALIRDTERKVGALG